MPTGSVRRAGFRAAPDGNRFAHADRIPHADHVTAAGRRGQPGGGSGAATGRTAYHGGRAGGGAGPGRPG
jgi:hypothetical protein